MKRNYLMVIAKCIYNEVLDKYEYLYFETLEDVNKKKEYINQANKMAGKKLLIIRHIYKIEEIQ